MFHTTIFSHFNVELVMFNSYARLFLNISKFWSIKYGLSKLDYFTMKTNAR